MNSILRIHLIRNHDGVDARYRIFLQPNDRSLNKTSRSVHRLGNEHSATGITTDAHAIDLCRDPLGILTSSPSPRETDRPKVRVQSQDRVEVSVTLRIHGPAVIVVINLNHSSYLGSQFETNQTSAIAAAEGVSM